MITLPTHQQPPAWVNITKRYATVADSIWMPAYSLPCCPQSNAFEAATRACRHLANGTECVAVCQPLITSYLIDLRTRSIWKMLGPFATASRRTPIHQVSLLSHAACASVSTATTTTTTTTTTRDREDRYGPIEWAQWENRTHKHTDGSLYAPLPLP